MSLSPDEPLSHDSLESSPSAAGAGAATARPSPSGVGDALQPTPADGAQGRCIAEISALLGEAAQQWQELQEAIEELRAELAPEELSEALAVAGLTAVKESQAAGSTGVEQTSAPAAERAPRARRAEHEGTEHEGTEHEGTGHGGTEYEGTGHGGDSSTQEPRMPEAAARPTRPAGPAQTSASQQAPAAATPNANEQPAAAPRRADAVSNATARAVPAAAARTTKRSRKKGATVARKSPAIAAPGAASGDATPAPSKARKSPAVAAPRRSIGVAAEAPAAAAAPQKPQPRAPERSRPVPEELPLAPPMVEPPQTAAPPATPIQQRGPESPGSGSAGSEPPKKTWLGREKKLSVDRKLEEVLDLLRGGMDGHAGTGLPSQLTDQIAREVAGRLKETVAETLRGASPGSNEEKSARAADPEPTSSSRIPLGDVQAIIDQLSRSQ